MMRYRLKERGASSGKQQKAQERDKFVKLLLRWPRLARNEHYSQRLQHASELVLAVSAICIVVAKTTEEMETTRGVEIPEINTSTHECG
ncbi:hypothetical protein HanIR_Chr12g0592091 [Helianthus annuus]|nr:hypothetical protein HanIR_Chr12g0592091 [Helianthus annuus]